VHNLDDLQNLATELAVSAGEILRKGKLNDDHGIMTKSSSTDVVTATDKASEHHIMNVLRERRPNDGLLGEEGTSHEGTTGVTWVVDPLDGTVNFLYGLSSLGVSIAAVIDGEPAVGAVYNPTLDELFTATAGGGAHCNGRPIECSTVDSLGSSLVATGFSYRAEDRAVQATVLQRVLPEVRDIRRLGAAALDLCHVACGRVDAYFEVGIHPWDVFAGLLIAREAGALATAYDGGLPKRDIVAASPRIHADLLDLVSGQ
jgi:myo-inositol-1(or 4)-monophosphatase